MLTVGLVPLEPILLTIKDGHGVPSDMDGAVRVIILSGAADGQAVPQGARMVDWNFVNTRIATKTRRTVAKKTGGLPGRWRLQPKVRGQRERTAF